MAEAMATGKYQFVMCNFAPPDMVGHTGVYDAAVKACTATGKRSSLLKNWWPWLLYFLWCVELIGPL